MKKIMKLNSLITMIILVFLTSCSKNEISDLTLNTSLRTLTVGETYSLIPTITASGDINKFPIKWTSSNSNVVEVIDGKIEALSTGSSIVTAKAGDLTTTCNIEVTNEIYPSLKRGYLVYIKSSTLTKVHSFQIELDGPKDTIYLYINAPLTATDSLPVGTYQMLTRVSYDEDFIPFSITPGELYQGDYYGSLYIGSTQNIIQDGSITLSTSKGIYLIDYNLGDNYGNKISGTFQGALNYYIYNKTSSTPASTKANVKPSFEKSRLNYKIILK